MNKKESITICIPLYNEYELIDELSSNLNKLYENLIKNIEVEFLLVDDGSTDDTFSGLNDTFINKNIYKIIKHEKNLNLGGFLRTSIDYSNSDYIAFLDSDSTFDPQLVVPMLELIKNNYDIVNASPYHPEGQTIGVGIIRKIISKTANNIYKKILNVNVYTYTSILKIYKLENIKNIKIETEGFVAVTELFVKSLLNNNKSYDFPCTLTTRRTGASKIRFISTVLLHINFMFKILKTKFR